MKIKLWIAIALVASLAMSTAAVAKDKPARDTNAAKAAKAEDQAVIKAAVHVHLRQFDEALALIEPLIATHDAQAATEKRAMFSARSLAETMDYMLGAANRHESSVVMPYSWGMALYLKGYVLIELNRGEEAKLWLERAVALSPSNAKFLGELGEWYKARGRFDEATALFKRAEIAAEFSPDEIKAAEKTRAMRGVAWVAVEQGRIDEGEAIYRQCLALNADDAFAKNELAYIAKLKAKKATY